MTDPIADMLTRIRNALAVKKAEVLIPFSKIKLEVADVLKKEGYIKNYKEIKENHGGIVISLKYDKNNKPVIWSLKRVSKPGQRIYVKKDQLPIVLNNLGIAIISTPKGLMTNKEAKKQGFGGEILCEIY